MLNLQTSGKLSLEFVRSILADHTRNGIGDICNQINGFYCSLVDVMPYYATCRNNKIVMECKRNYGNRESQRRRVYEIMEVVRDTVFHRMVEINGREVQF